MTNPKQPQPPKRNQKTPDRPWIGGKPPDDPLLFDFLSDDNWNMAFHALWEGFERRIQTTQRNCAKEEKPAVCVAVDEVLRDMRMYSEQGKLVAEYIKSLK